MRDQIGCCFQSQIGETQIKNEHVLLRRAIASSFHPEDPARKNKTIRKDDREWERGGEGLSYLRGGERGGGSRSGERSQKGGLRSAIFWRERENFCGKNA